MKKPDGAKYLEEVAKNHGISVAEVRREIELAINDAMLSPDPAAQAFWDTYIQSGRAPTLEEFIIYVAERVMSDIRPQVAWIQ